MNSIAINVKTNDGTILGTLDVFETEMNIVYQMIDIKDPEKRKSNYVREFDLPGTKNNNQIFNGISENGYSVHNYNPNHRLIAQVILNDNIFFEGNLQLNEITKLDNNKVGYKITIYGSLADFFNEIGTLPMSILDISEYNHKLSMPNIYSSWADKLLYRTDDWDPRSATGYIWKYGLKTPFRLGEGYVYPLQWMGQDKDTEIDLNNWQPAIYAKTLFDKIFSKYGWRYKSNFIESQYFRKLILPYANDTVNISDKVVQANEFKATLKDQMQVLVSAWSNLAQTLSSNKPTFFNDTALPAIDLGNVFNTTTSVYTVGKNGNYKLTTYLQVGVSITGIKQDGNTVPAFILTQPSFTGKAYIKDGGGNIVASKDFILPVLQNYSSNALKGMQVFAGHNIQAIVELEYPAYLTAGTQYHVEVDFTIPEGTYSTKTLDFMGTAFVSKFDFYVHGITDTNTSSITSVFTDKTITAEDIIDMNMCLPDMSMVDFITSINKMFNLYWQPTGDEKEFIIEPRDVIFSNTLAKDWTDKVNNGKVVSIKPLYDITGNKYKLSYGLDGDYYNDDYNKSYGETYGTKEVKVDNDFVTETIEIQTKFCSSPTVNMLDMGMYTPAMVSESGMSWKLANTKQRILFYGGVIPIPGGSSNKYIRLNDDFNVYGGSTKWKYYPYAGHLDNPVTPTQDLNYGVCKKYYWQWSNITNNNLFNKFWSNQVLESIDANSHLLTVEVILTDLDMTNFDLTWIIQVDNVHYRINKITYNPLTGVAEAELFKAKDIIPPTAISISSGSGTGVIPGTGNPWIGGTYQKYFGSSAQQYKLMDSDIVSPLSPWSVQGLPTLLPTYEYTLAPQFTYGQNYPTQTSLSNTWSDVVPQQGNVSGITDTNSYSIMAKQEVVGKRNIVARTGTNIKVIGDYNNVMDDTKNITIQGNNNRVLSGVQNVSIVGDNQIVTESNISMIQGMKIKSGGVVKSTRQISSTITSKGVIGGGFNNTTSINKEGYRGVISGGIDSAL